MIEAGLRFKGSDMMPADSSGARAMVKSFSPPLESAQVRSTPLRSTRLRSTPLQWKRGSVRFDELRKRGVDRSLAAKTAGSAHGPWRLAESPGLHFALPNAYFDSLGIPRLTAGR
jgi:hypothetical protein